jgi:sugar O-acyltransferase (sialic acid O-acetyltransferase NeuD family)
VTRLYIYGAGGFGREVAWLASETLGENVDLIFLVGDDAYLTDPVNGIEVRHVASVDADGQYVVAIGDSRARRVGAALCEKAGLQPTSLVHPRVERSRRVEIGSGSIVCAGSILTTNIEVGRHAHVNLDCAVGHDVRIGDYATLSPGVHVSGWVTIEEDAFIGTGATIINGSAGDPLVIGAGAVIAAGACVVTSADPGVLMAGVPAVRKRGPSGDNPLNGE